MSELLKLLKSDLNRAMKTEVALRKETCEGHECRWDTVQSQKTVARSIISMFPELGKKPIDATDDDVIKLLKKFISQEKERELYIQKHLVEEDVDGLSHKELRTLVSKKITELGDDLDTLETMIAKKYLPKEASEEEIKDWINNNIDFSQFKNKMQAMGPIMKQFKGADGNFVKSILLSL